MGRKFCKLANYSRTFAVCVRVCVLWVGYSFLASEPLEKTSDLYRV